MQFDIGSHLPNRVQCTIGSMTIKTWLDIATQEADRRGLSALKPLLETLARATASLRSADWNADATGQFETPTIRTDVR